MHLYTSDLVATQIAPDVRRLRRFEKISLKPGEKQTVTFTLPARELAYAGRDGLPVLEAGEFDVLVGNQTARFNLTEYRLARERFFSRKLRASRCLSAGYI